MTQTQTPTAEAGMTTLREAAKLSELIRTRLLGVRPDEQDLELEDTDWRLIRAALARHQAPAVDLLAERDRIAKAIKATWDDLTAPVDDSGIAGLGGAWTRTALCGAFADAIFATRPTDPGGARGEIVRHVKSGREYEVLVRGAQIQTDTPLTDYAKVDVYRGSDGATWVRPVSEMYDGRFVPAASTASSDAGGATDA